MVDFHKLFLQALSLPAELLLHSNYTLCFWGTVLALAWLRAPSAALLALLAALFALLGSYGKRPCPLPRYQGPLDVWLGRSYRASTLTPDMPANNNVSISTFLGKHVIAYRKAESHFASPTARIVVATCEAGGDLGAWQEVWHYHTGEDDLRETLFFQMQGRLFLYFACLAPLKRGFTPRRMSWTSTRDLVAWTKPVEMTRDSEITWDVQVREEGAGREVAYKVSYTGNHYAAGAVLSVHFERSTDGEAWHPVGKDSIVYSGGISEVSFAFTPEGHLVAIGRNEDGDATGFGSQLFYADKADLGAWTPLRVSLPYRFDSPRLRCIEGELLLFARFARERYCLTPKWVPFDIQRTVNLVLYSLLPKSAAVYRLRLPEKGGAWHARPVEMLRCLEETHGDTGFFSLAPCGEDWVIANYSSSCHSHAPWLYGQVFATDVYVCRCKVLRTP